MPAQCRTSPEMEVWHLLCRPECPFLFYKSWTFRFVYGSFICLLFIHQIQRAEITTPETRTMGSRLVVVVELLEESCSPQVLEHVLGQMRDSFHILSSRIRETSGQHLRVT